MVVVIKHLVEPILTKLFAKFYRILVTTKLFFQCTSHHSRLNRKSVSRGHLSSGQRHVDTELGAQGESFDIFPWGKRRSPSRGWDDLPRRRFPSTSKEEKEDHHPQWHGFHDGKRHAARRRARRRRVRGTIGISHFIDPA